MINNQGRKAEIEALIRRKMGLPPAQAAMPSTQNPMHGAEEQMENPAAPDPDDQGPPIIDEAQTVQQMQNAPPAPGAGGYGGQPSIMEMAQMGGLGQVAPVQGGVPGMMQNNVNQYRDLINTPVNGHMASQGAMDMAQPMQGKPEGPSALELAVMKLLNSGPQSALASTNKFAPKF
jgi:hypothetical protein